MYIFNLDFVVQPWYLDFVVQPWYLDVVQPLYLDVVVQPLYLVVQPLFCPYLSPCIDRTLKCKNSLTDLLLGFVMQPLFLDFVTEP